jgi:hypothetical protein
LLGISNRFNESAIMTLAGGTLAKGSFIDGRTSSAASARSRNHAGHGPARDLIRSGLTLATLGFYQPPADYCIARDRNSWDFSAAPRHGSCIIYREESAVVRREAGHCGCRINPL